MISYFSILGINSTIFILNVIFSIIAISLEKRNVNTALAWLFFMTLFPGFGFFMFLLLSQNISKRKIFKYTQQEKHAYKKLLAGQGEKIVNGEFKFSNKTIKAHSDMIIFHNKLSDSIYSQNNQIQIFTDGHQKFESLLKDIQEATHHIHILYYIIKNDTLGNRFLDLLERKALEGVEVRLLVDSIGGRTLTKKQIKKLKASGCEVAFFFPSKLKYINFKANYRNHRKIVVIDGAIGYIGGFNIGDEYIGLKKRFGYWRDTHLRIMGDSVASLQLRFFLDWRNAKKMSLEITSTYFKKANTDYKAGVQIVSCGPDSIHQQIKQGFIKMINSAKKYIYIQTPYFIPDESIAEAIKIAAISGVDVRIMIPKMPDHIFVYWASYANIGALLDYGVKAYIYEKGFLHAKTIVVDDVIASVGSCNFDIRSFKLNFEANAFIYDRKTSTQLKNIFMKDLNNSKEILLADYKKRSLALKIKETISILFSPLL
jgi:cardiolipin synthase